MLPIAALKPTASTSATSGRAYAMVAAQQRKHANPLIASSGLGSQMVTRDAGVGVLAAGIAVNGVGLCALGLGILFHGLVSGIARNPALKEDLMVYAMIGVGMVEFFAIVILLLSGLLLYTE